MDNPLPHEPPAPRRRRWVLWLGIPTALVLAAQFVRTYISPWAREYKESHEKRNQALARQDMLYLYMDLERYAEGHRGQYPPTLRDLFQKDAQGFDYSSFEEIPLDPWGRAYGYLPPDEDREDPRLFSLGADGAYGGTGPDKDIEAPSFLSAARLLTR